MEFNLIVAVVYLLCNLFTFSVITVNVIYQNATWSTQKDPSEVRESLFNPKNLISPPARPRRHGLCLNSSISMQMCRRWLRAANGLLQNDLRSTCHDSVCSFKLPVKHRAILLPEALVYLFEQDQGAGGIQIGSSTSEEEDLCKTKIFCVFYKLDDGHARVRC